MNLHGLRYCLVALALLMLSCSGKNKDESVATSDEPQASAAASSGVEEIQQARVKDLGALVDLIVAEAADLPRAEFEPAALASKLGKDPQAHFEWVREHTWWAPYRGLLRGSQGVMLDRVGSNLDRAVLLGDLLRHAGHTVRLAHAELTPARAREFLGEVRPMPGQRRALIAPRAMSAERRRAIEAVLPGFEKELEERAAESKRRTAEADALVRSQSDALLAASRDAASSDQADESSVLTALQDHWWVEREDDGKWIAMDVMLPKARAGETPVTASSISEWSAAKSFPSIPETEWHSVGMRVVVERFEAGDMSESTVLEAVLRPAEVLGKPVRLIHVPAPWPNAPPDPHSDAQPLREAALGVKLWVPVLQVGDNQVVQSGFTVEGDLKTKLVDSLGDVRKAGGAEVVSGMDIALGGFGAEEITPAATAEWIDYEIRVPGVPTQRLRRPVFDLLGPARRSSKSADFDGTADLRKLERFEALWSQTDILLQPCDFTGEFVAHLGSAGIVANQQALKELAREREPATAKGMASEILTRLGLLGPLPNLALWRSALGGQTTEWIIDRPNVLNYRISWQVIDAEQAKLRQLIDIASNGTAVIQGGHRGPFEIRLRQGVADTVGEMLTLGSDLRAAENTASIFATLAAENSRGLLIGARDSATARGLPWPPDEIERVAGDVEAGFSVVVPRKPVVLGGQQRVGWWRVDPMSGETIGVMDTGFHADTAEYTAARSQMGRLFNWLYETNRYRDWRTLQLMAENNLPMTAQQAYNLRLFNLTARAIEDIAFFVL